MVSKNTEKETPTPRLKGEKTPKAKDSEDLNRDAIVKDLNGRKIMVYFFLLNKK